jgi:hypothetical protein
MSEPDAALKLWRPAIIKWPEEDESMSYVIKLTTIRGKRSRYVGAVPVATNHDDVQVRTMERKGLSVYDFKNTLFETLEEASQFPYPTAEAAASVIPSFPNTKNIEYEVVATDDDLDESMGSQVKINRLGCAQGARLNRNHSDVREGSRRISAPCNREARCSSGSMYADSGNAYDNRHRTSLGLENKWNPITQL